MSNICSWLVWTHFDLTTFCLLIVCFSCKWLSRKSWYFADSPLGHEFHIWADSTRTRITRTDKKYRLCFCKNPGLHFYRMRLGWQKQTEYGASGFQNVSLSQQRGKSVSGVSRDAKSGRSGRYICAIFFQPVLIFGLRTRKNVPVPVLLTPVSTDSVSTIYISNSAMGTF